jgi:hypothetical protein
VTHPGVSFDEVRARFFAEVDGAIAIETISPRLFEAAALRCAMINLEGRYAGLIEPDVHYVQVARDYGNADAVADRIRDRAFCRQLTDAAHRDLIASDRYSYRTFARTFDQQLSRHVRERRSTVALSRATFLIRRLHLSSSTVVPWHATFTVVPSLVTVPGAILRAGGRLPGFSRTKIGTRCRTDPESVLLTAWILGRLVVRTRWMRRLFGMYLRARVRGGTVALSTFVEDCTKLEVVRRFQSRTLRAREEFALRVEFDAETALLRIVSSTVAADEGLPAPAGVPADAEAALLNQRVLAMIWLHDGRTVDYELWPGRWFTFNFWNGVYRFDAIAQLSAASARGARIVSDVIRGDRRLSEEPSDRCVASPQS